MAASSEHLAYEQGYADRVYSRIDELIAHLKGQLMQVIAEQGASTHQNRSERDSFASFYENRIALLEAVAHNALFGRLDMEGGARHYIGRIGVFTADREQLVVDWRAPAAAAFYQATPVNPLGVRLRRHLVTQGRTVTGIEDDVLDTSLLSTDEEASTLQGEGALLAAVSAARTGRMGDIVATIQAEQDAIIRHPSKGVLVVQGGPGTGKTAVALHRAAYQLYTHRARLEHSGVLIVAPTRGFLRYIERVLPSLGESGVVMQTPGELFPSIDTTARDADAVATVKGGLAMARVLKRAVKQRQQIPHGPIDLSIDGVHITLTPAMVRAARAEARATARPHNRARTTFVRAMLDSLADAYHRELVKLGHSVTEEDRPDLISDLRHNHQVKVTLNRCWLPYTPQSFLRSFFASRARVLQASKDLLTREEALLLVRDKDSAWTIDDVPLLDEVAELLGEDDAAKRREEAENEEAARSHVEYATKVLEMMDADGIVSAEDLAAQVGYRRDRRTLAERALLDRRWTYGHVVVDEAQELSPMMWRLLMRRNPTKSFTIVGDIAQTSSAAGSTSWRETLSPFVEDRVAVEELTVNYRTPARIMRGALSVAAAHDLHVTAVTSVREGEHDIEAIDAPDAGGVAGAAMDALERARSVAGGRLALIARAEDVPALVRAARERFGAAAVGAGSRGIDAEIAVLTPGEAKGLEFDATVVVEPRAIAQAHARGANDLYVAMTRPTQFLALVGAEGDPDGLR